MNKDNIFNKTADATALVETEKEFNRLLNGKGLEWMVQEAEKKEEA
jgi:hypothetical protein